MSADNGMVVYALSDPNARNAVMGTRYIGVTDDLDVRTRLALRAAPKFGARRPLPRTVRIGLPLRATV